MHDDLQMRRKLRELGRDEHPQRDLWPDISARLEPRRRSTTPLWLAAASAAGLAVLVGGLVRDQAPTIPPELATHPLPAQIPVSGLNGELASIELAYAQGLHELTAGMDARASMALKVVRPALRQLDQVALDLQSTLRSGQQPDRELISELSQTRRQQLKLARTAIMESWS